MNITERQGLYKQAVADLHQGENIRFSDAFGVSNSGKIVGGGLFAFNANFNSYSGSSDQIAIHCLLRFPPEDEIYFTIVIKGGLPTFLQRLEEMKSVGAGAIPKPDNLDYTDNNKNMKGYIAGDGNLYLRNKSYWDELPTDLSTISKPIPIERIYFAIWPPTPICWAGTAGARVHRLYRNIDRPRKSPRAACLDRGNRSQPENAAHALFYSC